MHPGQPDRHGRRLGRPVLRPRLRQLHGNRLHAATRARRSRPSTAGCGRSPGYPLLGHHRIVTRARAPQAVRPVLGAVRRRPLGRRALALLLRHGGRPGGDEGVLLVRRLAATAAGPWTRPGAGRVGRRPTRPSRARGSTATTRGSRSRTASPIRSGPTRAGSPSCSEEIYTARLTRRLSWPAGRRPPVGSLPRPRTGDEPIPQRALIVIDVQNEYFDGALPISDRRLSVSAPTSPQRGGSTTTTTALSTMSPFQPRAAVDPQSAHLRGSHTSLHLRIERSRDIPEQTYRSVVGEVPHASSDFAAVPRHRRHLAEPATGSSMTLTTSSASVAAAASSNGRSSADARLPRSGIAAAQGRDEFLYGRPSSARARPSPTRSAPTLARAGSTRASSDPC